jgi:hypothetical protein
MIQLLAPASLRAASVGAMPTASGCSAPLSLALRPGLTEPNNHVSMPAAPNIPSGPVVIHVPLYPGAGPSVLHMPQAQYTVPSSQYLKAATAEYVMSTDWTTASDWYQRAFMACGYITAGSGYSGARGETVSIGISMRDPRHPRLEVALAFDHGPAGKTLVLYVAYTIALPPPATMVPGSSQSVEILSYRSFAQGQLAASRPSKDVVVRDSQSIGELIHHLNSLPPPQGIMSCPQDDGSHDTLLFAYQDGRHVTVDVGVQGCRIVRSGKKAGFAGADNGLFRLLASLLARKTGVGPGVRFHALSAVRARPAHVYTSQIRAHGVFLSISLARRTYPQDALVRVTVRLVNVSRRTVRVGATSGPVLGHYGPGVQVLGAGNQVLYPPAAEWVLAGGAKPVRPAPLLPGHTLQRKLLAILRGDRIQGIASLGAQSVRVLTPPLKLELTNEPAPHLTLITSAPAEIDVTPATPDQRGMFYLTTSILCLHAPDAGGNEGGGSGDARFERGTVGRDGVFRLPAGCDPPTRWSFAGGWLNHPAVTVDYSAPVQATP